MSQHSFSIPNESGASFRGDVNDALQALASLNSGTSAPSTTYAYQPWYDTTNGLLKIRNGANSAWIIIGPLADSTKHVIYTNNTAQVTVDSSGKVGVGNPTPTYQMDVTGDINATGSLRVGGVAIPTGYNFINGGTASFSSNAYTITPSPAISAYAANQLFLVYIANANTTTTPTLNANAQGAKTIKKQIGGGKVAVAVGDLQANTFGFFAYDGTDMMLINPRSNSQGADIASASTINLDTATGNYVHVTGTTTITAVTLSQGRECKVVFDGILTLTNGASLILPSGANITTAAGDVAVFRGEASSVVRCISYSRADGSAVISSGGGAGGATETSGSSSITLTNSSNRVQSVAMTAAGKHVKLPDATTLSAAGGPLFIVRNVGAYMFPVIDAGGQAIALLSPGEGAMLYCANIGSAKGKWYAGKGDCGDASSVFGGTSALGVVGESSGTVGYTHTCAYISDQKFLFGWTRSSGSFRVVVVSITDAGTLSVGTSVQVVSAASMGQNFAMCPLDASNVAVAYSYTSVNSIVVVGISGTTATVGTPTSVVAATSSCLHLHKISSSSVFYGYYNSATSKGVVISGMSTSGNTVNSITTCRAAAGSAGLSIAQADVNTYFYATLGTSSYLDVQMVTVSGTTVTANTALANSSSSAAISSVCAAALSTSLFIVGYVIADVLFFASFRISTGTTLELLDGGGKSLDGSSVTRLGAVLWNQGSVGTFRGWVVLNNYAILLIPGPYPTPLNKFIFKFNAEMKEISFVRRETTEAAVYGGDSIGPLNGCAKVSEGKYAITYTNASSYPAVTIFHGITNP